MYEYVTGGGTLGEPDSPMLSGSLLREGRSMVAALAADFLDIPGADVFLLRDIRLPDFALPDCRHVLIRSCEQEQAAIERLASTADRTVIIAPETDGALADRCRWAEAAGGRLASPSLDFVTCASDKNLAAELLRAGGVPVPESRALRPEERLPGDFPYPAVLKPADGAGSIGIQWIADANSHYDAAALGCIGRLEAYCPGCPASVAVLCGPAGKTPLPPCRQLLAGDGSLRYLGGELPLQEGQIRRAERLAVASIGALPPVHGYVGVDLVLGPAADGSEDFVIEVNPRLTTSYIGLRRLLQTNLASATLCVLDGGDVELSFARRRVKFGV